MTLPGPLEDVPDKGNGQSAAQEIGAGRSVLIWISCHSPVISIGLEQILEEEFRVHRGSEEPPNNVPSCVVLRVEAEEGLPESVGRVRRHNPEAPVLVFGTRADLPLAWSAFKAGASGFIYAEMKPEQLVRAFKVALEGDIVAPGGLLEYVFGGEETASLNLLSPRQREILHFVADGLSNAQIARRVFLSEFTVKQHLRNAYKLLGVKNRTEAARIIRGSR